MSGLTYMRLRFASRFYAALALVAVVLIASGCATQQQIEKIVADSNARLIASQLPAMQLPGKPGELPRKPGDVEQDDVVERIEQFIAEHPEQKTLNASLRVRQAMVYLNRKDYNLAQAAFNEAARGGPPVSARDAALVEVSKHLIWWHRHSGLSESLTKEQRQHAAEARTAFIQQAKKRPDSPDIRDVLAELSVWVGFKEINSLPDFPAQQTLLQQVMDDYSFIFSEDDLKLLCNPDAGENAKDAAAFRTTDAERITAVRRRIRAEPVIAQATRVVQTWSGKLKPAFKHPTVQDLVAPSQPGRCKR